MRRLFSWCPRMLWALVVVLDWLWLKRLYLALHPETRDLRLTRDTELLIDGYSRSGNTWTVCAFEQANGTGRRLAHHLHDARWVERAVKLGVPTIVLVRRPEDAVASMLSFEPRSNVLHLLDSYGDYYERITPLAAQVVVVPFEAIEEARVGEVIVSVNERYGTAFVPYVSDAESDLAVNAAVEEFGRQHYASSDFEARVSRPSAQRLREPLFLAGLDERGRAALERARHAYASVAAYACTDCGRSASA